MPLKPVNRVSFDPGILNGILGFNIAESLSPAKMAKIQIKQIQKQIEPTFYSTPIEKNLPRRHLDKIHAQNFPATSMRNSYYCKIGVQQSLAIILSLCLLISCESRSARRSYEEIVIPAQDQQWPIPEGEFSSAIDPSAPILLESNPEPISTEQKSQKDFSTKIFWKTPPGWVEHKGQGLRIASFTSEDQELPIECSIISLGGEAGGLKANVIRWINQIQIPVPDDRELDRFLSQQPQIETEGGLKILIVDLSQLQPEVNETTPSMLAGIMETLEKTFFVKLTGSKKVLRDQKKKFYELCRSLQVKE